MDSPSHVPRVLFALMLLVISMPPLIQSFGSGPIGIWIAPPLSNDSSRWRIAIIADSSIPGLATVDINDGLTLEQLELSSYDVDPIGIMTCLNCTYALVTGNGGRCAFLRFTYTVEEILRSPHISIFQNVEIQNLLLTEEPFNATDIGTKRTRSEMGLSNASDSSIRSSMGDNRIGVMSPDGRLQRIYRNLLLYLDRNL